MRLASAPIVLSLGLLLSGCAEVQQTLDNSGGGFLPGKSTDATNHTARITTLWIDSWIVLWAVGIIAWALMIWAMIAYRRRKGENRIPVQLRYNNPIEALFTIVPFVLVIGFFAITARDMSAIEAPVEGSRNVQVIGKQWSWDFNYTESNVHETGIQSQFAGETGSKDALPTLWLQKDVPVKLTLDARDVIHSFWVIDFLYKKDLIPGKTNYIYFTPTKLGDFDGKCAELCGEYHSLMLFNVKVVDKADYDAHMADLQAQGNTGLLGNDLNRNQNLPGDNPDIRG
jgi:cytochrome c oxidase subunit 2